LLRAIPRIDIVRSGALFLQLIQLVSLEFATKYKHEDNQNKDEQTFHQRIVLVLGPSWHCLNEGNLAAK
jgi:hypothetical protein